MDGNAAILDMCTPATPLGLRYSDKTIDKHRTLWCEQAVSCSTRVVHLVAFKFRSPISRRLPASQQPGGAYAAIVTFPSTPVSPIVLCLARKVAPTAPSYAIIPHTFFPSRSLQITSIIPPLVWARGLQRGLANVPGTW